MNTGLFKALKRTLFLLVVAALVVGVIAAQLSHTEAADSSIVRVKLSIDTTASFSFALSGNYGIEGKPEVSLASGTYTVKIESGALRLYLGGTLVTSGPVIKITELAPPSGGYNYASIKTTKYGTNNYRGAFEFRISGDAIVAINHIYLDYYLYGVVPHEMSNSWPLEALKAQAVAARTYAVRYMGSGAYDLVDTSANQVYKGFNPAHDNAIRAVDETAKVVLKCGDELVPTYYAASNGGHVDIPQHVWSAGAALRPYHVTQPDPYDLENTYSVQEVLVFPKTGGGGVQYRYMKDGAMVAGSSALSANAERYFKISALPAVAAQGYIAAVSGDVEIEGVQRITAHTYAGNHGLPDYTGGNNCVCFKNAEVIMTVLAYRRATAEEEQQTGSAHVREPVTVTFGISLDKLNEAGGTYRSFDNASLRLFVVEETATSWNICHRRYGHGIGMSQRGAQTQARAGRTYRQILTFYYPNTTFETLNISPPAPGAPGSAADTANATIINCVNYVNVRSTPGTTYPAIGKAFAGARITVTQPNAAPDWHKISFGGIDAYISADYVQIDSAPAEPALPGEPAEPAEPVEPVAPEPPTPTEPAAKPAIAQTGTATAGSLNIRSGAGTSYAVLGGIAKGTQVEIIEAYAAAGWHKIWYKNQIAYVSAQYIALQNGIQATGVITASVLNVRSGAGTTFAAIGRLIKGAKVDIITLNEAPGWHKLSYNGNPGYIHADYVNISGAAGDGGAVAAYATVNASAVNFRQTASLGGKILKTLSRGSVVQVLETGAEWYQVRHGGIEGYMYAQYLAPSKTVYGTVNVSVLNVRGGAATSAAILGKLLKNDVAEITQKGGEWHKIKYKSSTAYVYATYIKLQ